MTVHLNPRERQALELAAMGLQYKQIAKIMDCSPWAPKNLLDDVRRKLEARNTTEAVAIALRLHLIT